LLDPNGLAPTSGRRRSQKRATFSPVHNDVSSSLKFPNPVQSKAPAPAFRRSFAHASSAPTETRTHPRLPIWPPAAAKASSFNQAAAGEMTKMPGRPGTSGGLVLRTGQFVFAAACICAMASASGFTNYTAFWYCPSLPCTLV